MELHRNQATNDAARRANNAREAFESQSDRASEMRAAAERLSRARAAQQALAAERTEANRASAARTTDSLELSAAGLLINGEDDARAELVESLRVAYERGDLNTKARIERAAHNLLGGE